MFRQGPSAFDGPAAKKGPRPGTRTFGFHQGSRYCGEAPPFQFYAGGLPESRPPPPKRYVRECGIPRAGHAQAASIPATMSSDVRERGIPRAGHALLTPAGDSSGARPAPAPRGILRARAIGGAPRLIEMHAVSQMAVARNSGPAGRPGPWGGKAPAAGRPPQARAAATPDAPPWIGADGARFRGSRPILPIVRGKQC